MSPNFDSSSRRCSSSFFGLVKGWCTAFHLSVSLSFANRGKSVTQRKLSAELSFVRPRYCEHSRRILPRTSHTFNQSPAPNKMRSPSSIDMAAESSSFSLSEKNFTIGDFHSPSSTFINAKPLAP